MSLNFTFTTLPHKKKKMMSNHVQTPNDGKTLDFLNFNELHNIVPLRQKMHRRCLSQISPTYKHFQIILTIFLLKIRSNKKLSFLLKIKYYHREQPGLRTKQPKLGI